MSLKRLLMVYTHVLFIQTYFILQHQCPVSLHLFLCFFFFFSFNCILCTTHFWQILLLSQWTPFLATLSQSSNYFCLGGGSCCCIWPVSGGERGDITGEHGSNTKPALAVRVHGSVGLSCSQPPHITLVNTTLSECTFSSKQFSHQTLSLSACWCSLRAGIRNGGLAVAFARCDFNLVLPQDRIFTYAIEYTSVIGLVYFTLIGNDRNDEVSHFMESFLHTDKRLQSI